MPIDLRMGPPGPRRAQDAPLDLDHAGGRAVTGLAALLRCGAERSGMKSFESAYLIAHAAHVVAHVGHFGAHAVQLGVYTPHLLAHALHCRQ